MKSLKKLTAALCAVTVTLSLAGCSSKTNSQEAAVKQEVKKSLTVGLTPGTDAIPFIIAKENGYFEKQGLEVNLEVFKSAKDRDAAFQSGALDGALSDEVAVTLYQNGGFDVKITGITDGDFMLVAGKDSGIKSVSDLKGKKIAVSQKTVIEYTLDKLLEKESVSSEEVEKVAIPAIPTRLEMLKNNKIDAALLPEPFSTFAINDGAILLNSAYSEGMYPNVSVFTQESIDTKGKEINAFYKAYAEAVEYVNKTPISEYEDIVIKTIGYPEEMRGKIKLPKYRESVIPSDADLQAAIDWSTKKGFIKQTIKPSDMVSDIATK
jgi:NitT/TauT family transport system substrate-binding protein